MQHQPGSSVGRGSSRGQQQLPGSGRGGLSVFHSLRLATVLLLAVIMPGDRLLGSWSSSRSSSRGPAAVAEASYGSWHECNSQATYGGLYGAELVANLTTWRSSLLSHIWSSFDPSVPYATGHKRFDPMSPFISCPPHQPLIRYGSEADGGKLLCDMSRVKPPCLIYSLGSNGDYTFEQDMVNVTQCEIHTFDCTYNGKSIHERHTYHKVCVGRGGADFKTWDEITRSLGHHHRSVDVAKIDIEGHEPAVLSEFRHNTPLPRQIVIEIHLRPAAGTAIASPAPRTPAQVALMFMHLASLGYGVVGKEDNIWGEAGCCAEFTFLHVERQWLGFLGRATHARASGGAGGLFQQVKASLGGSDAAAGDAAAVDAAGNNNHHHHRRHRRVQQRGWAGEAAGAAGAQP